MADALQCAAYEFFKSYIAEHEGHQPGTLVKLACGGTAGAISQTLTYPLDVLRRRMQVSLARDGIQRKAG